MSSVERRGGEDEEPVVCRPGAFVSVPPRVRHAYGHRGTVAGRLLGMMMPAGAGGLESFFRQRSVPVHGPDDIPDLDQPVAHLREVIAERRG